MTGVRPERQEDRRRHERIAGPFEGRRIGALETPVQIHDLSLGGCFVNSLHEQQIGAPITLEIDLPDEGAITVRATTLYRRGGFGFAVQFADMSDDSASRLARCLERLRSRSPRAE